MKPTTKAVVGALLKAPLNSLRELTSKETDSDTKYLFCMAHPDDEILIAGMGRRASLKGVAQFMTVTDGSANTDKDRLPELQRSYQIMGYSGDVDNLMSETEIYDLANSTPGNSASRANVSRLALLVDFGAREIEKRILDKKIDAIVTTSFEGGHLVHDLTNMMAYIASKNSGIPIYETPQYSLVPMLGASIEEIQGVINHNRSKNKRDKIISLGPLAHYNMGVPLENLGGLEDSSLGVNGGAFRVTLGDVRRKIKMKKAHASQGKSLGGSSRNVTHATFSTEWILRVPTHRDYTSLPAGAYPLYELCGWRRNPMSFETFKSVAREIFSGKPSRVVA